MPGSTHSIVSRLCLLFGLVLLTGPGQAQVSTETVHPGHDNVHLELNKLAPQQDACRAWLVIGNETPHRFETLQLDLVAFDTQGIVATRLAIETAPLPPGKTSLKVFDMAGLSCENTGRVLLNTVMACADETGPREDCLDRLVLTTRQAVPFVK